MYENVQVVVNTSSMDSKHPTVEPFTGTSENAYLRELRNSLDIDYQPYYGQA